MFPTNPHHTHLRGRAFLNATLAAAGGMAVANWGTLSGMQTTMLPEGRRTVDHPAPRAGAIDIHERRERLA